VRDAGAVRDLSRLHEISLTFIRHGLGDLVRRLGVATLLERAGEVLLWTEAARSAQLEPQQRLRLAFEELGPSFIKLGQMLSMREDLLPPKWTTELARLRSNAAPVPFEQILAVIERSLGTPHAQAFVDLEREPAGAASIAQVHRARLPGRAVVLKVRRPGIEAG
jgi:ubiquinone biosynthesis protein